MLSMIFINGFKTLKARFVRLLLLTLLFGVAGGIICGVGVLMISNSSKPQTAASASGSQFSPGDGTVTTDPSSAAAAAKANKPGGSTNSSGSARPKLPLMKAFLLVVALLLVASVGFGSLLHAVGNDMAFVDDLKAGYNTLGKVGSQLTILTLPQVFLTLIGLPTGNTVILIIGMVLSTIISLATIGSILVAVGDAVLGEGQYLPINAITATRENPRLVVVGGIVCMAAGFVPVVGILLFICMGVALWQLTLDDDAMGRVDESAAFADDSLMAGDPLNGDQAAIALQEVGFAQQPDPNQAAEPYSAQQYEQQQYEQQQYEQQLYEQQQYAQAQAQQYSPSAAAAPPQPSQVLEGVLNPGTQFADWVGVHNPGNVTLQLAWSDGPVPTLHLADQAGAWMQIPAIDDSGVINTQLQAGWYYACITPVGVAPQSFRLSVYAPPAAGVA